MIQGLDESGRPFNLWCLYHWSKVVINPEVNAMKITIILSKKVFNDERFVKICGGDSEKGILAQIEEAHRNLPTISPLCCFLGDEVMYEVYWEASIDNAIVV